MIAGVQRGDVVGIGLEWNECSIRLRQGHSTTFRSYPQKFTERVMNFFFYYRVGDLCDSF